jgi:hypothetical protein
LDFDNNRTTGEITETISLFERIQTCINEGCRKNIQIVAKPAFSTTTKENKCVQKIIKAASSRNFKNIEK